MLGARSLALLCLAVALSLVPAVVAGEDGDAAAGFEGRILVQFAGREDALAVARQYGQEDSFLTQRLNAVVVPVSDVDGAISTLDALPGVSAASRISVATAAAVPNDPAWTGFNGQTSYDQAWYMQLIQAPAAWDIETGSPDTVIAVLDTGIHESHPDLTPVLWLNDRAEDEYCGTADLHGCRFMAGMPPAQAALCNYVTPEAAVAAIQDDDPDSHGTFSASVAGARGNNGLGLAGAAWDARIMTVKVLDCQGRGYTSGIIEGIFYAIEYGADVLNLSFVFYDGITPLEQSLLQEAIDAANQAGVVVVGAAGNDGATGLREPRFPASANGVIAVGASGNENFASSPAQFPSCGINDEPGSTRFGDIVAPGAEIIGAYFQGFHTYACGYGTSFSAPLVSGLAALVLSMNPTLSPSDVAGLIVDFGDALPPSLWEGTVARRVNMERTLRAVPATFRGAARLNFDTLPPNTTLFARINGVECGATLVGAGGDYELRVHSALTRSGCGTQGAVIEVRETAANQTAYLTFDGRLNEADLEFVEQVPLNPVFPTMVAPWSEYIHLRATSSIPTPGLGLFLTAYQNGEPERPWRLYQFVPDEEHPRGGIWLRHVSDAPPYVSTLGSIQQFQAYWLGTEGTPTSWSTSPQTALPESIVLSPGWNGFGWWGETTPVADALAGLGDSWSEVWWWDQAVSAFKRHVRGGTDADNDFQAFLRYRVYWLYYEGDEAVGLPVP